MEPFIRFWELRDLVRITQLRWYVPTLLYDPLTFMSVSSHQSSHQSAL
jgi:hypothetical protein